jgi:hypothetical protein
VWTLLSHSISISVYKWISRRRKDWAFEVDTLNVRETIYNLSFSTKSIMKTVSEKLIELDNTEWYRELFNDRHNDQNGNKLRTYRLYKHDVKSAPYVLQNISRFERRTMALFRSGALPLAYETGRYSRPPVPVDDRLCVLQLRTCGEWKAFSHGVQFVWRFKIQSVFWNFEICWQFSYTWHWYQICETDDLISSTIFAKY